MSKLNQLQNLLRSSLAARVAACSKPSQGISPFLRDTPRRFSTEAERPQDAAVEKILETPNTGVAYGKLFGITRLSMKSDIVNFLEGSNLKADDVRMIYNRTYVPMGMVIRFPSRYAFDQARRTIMKKGRIYRLESVDISQWESQTSYDGKTLLLQGIPRTSLIDDVERFLTGCEYDSSSIQLFYRQAFPDPIRMATVKFPTQAQAASAFLMKNRGFCQNNQILLRVLQ